MRSQTVRLGFLAALMAVHWAALAQTPAAPTLKPLSAVVAELRSDGDLTKMAYFFKRCGGYSLAMAKLLQGAGSDQHKATAEGWRKHGHNSIEVASLTEQEIEKNRNGYTKKSATDWLYETTGVAIEFGDIYIARMNQNYLRSGNYVIDDPWLAEEMKLCRDTERVVTNALQ